MLLIFYLILLPYASRQEESRSEVVDVLWRSYRITRRTGRVLRKTNNEQIRFDEVSGVLKRHGQIKITPAERNSPSDYFELNINTTDDTSFNWISKDDERALFYSKGARAEVFGTLGDPRWLTLNEKPSTSLNVSLKDRRNERFSMDAAGAELSMDVKDRWKISLSAVDNMKTEFGVKSSLPQTDDILLDIAGTSNTLTISVTAKDEAQFRVSSSGKYCLALQTPTSKPVLFVDTTSDRSHPKNRLTLASKYRLTVETDNALSIQWRRNFLNVSSSDLMIERIDKESKTTSIFLRGRAQMSMSFTAEAKIQKADVGMGDPEKTEPVSIVGGRSLRNINVSATAISLTIKEHESGAVEIRLKATAQKTIFVLTTSVIEANNEEIDFTIRVQSEFSLWLDSKETHLKQVPWKAQERNQINSCPSTGSTDDSVREPRTAAGDFRGAFSFAADGKRESVTEENEATETTTSALSTTTPLEPTTVGTSTASTTTRTTTTAAVTIQATTITAATTTTAATVITETTTATTERTTSTTPISTPTTSTTTTSTPSTSTTSSSTTTTSTPSTSTAPSSTTITSLVMSSVTSTLFNTFQQFNTNLTSLPTAAGPESVSRQKRNLSLFDPYPPDDKYLLSIFLQAIPAGTLSDWPEFLEKIRDGLRRVYVEGRRRQTGAGGKHHVRLSKDSDASDEFTEVESLSFDKRLYNRVPSRIAKRALDSEAPDDVSVKIIGADRLSKNEAIIKFYLMSGASVVDGTKAKEAMNQLSVAEISALLEYAAKDGVKLLLNDDFKEPSSPATHRLILAIVGLSIAMCLLTVALLVVCIFLYALRRHKNAEQVVDKASLTRTKRYPKKTASPATHTPSKQLDDPRGSLPDLFSYVHPRAAPRKTVQFTGPQSTTVKRAQDRNAALERPKNNDPPFAPSSYLDDLYLRQQLRLKHARDLVEKATSFETEKGIETALQKYNI